MLSWSKKRQLVWVFLLAFSALAGKSDDIFILLVRKSQNMNVAAVGKIGLDPAQIGFKLLFAITETSIDGKLAFLESVADMWAAMPRKPPSVRTTAANPTVPCSAASPGWWPPTAPRWTSAVTGSVPRARTSRRSQSVACALAHWTTCNLRDILSRCISQAHGDCDARV